MNQNQFRQPPRQNSGFNQPAQGNQNPPAQAGHNPFRANAPQNVPAQQHRAPVRQVHPAPQQQMNSGYQAPAHQGHAPMEQYEPQYDGGFHQGQPTQSYGNTRKDDSKPKMERPEWFLQLNTFGGKCAFQVETSMTKNGWHTVNIESAERENPNDPNNKRYLWNNKTVLQMTKSELPVFAAVMLGLLPSARFDNHDSKFLEIQNQGKNFFIKSGGQNKGLHVAPMPTVEAYMYGSMALAQYCRNFHGLSAEAGLQIIRGLARQLSEFGGHKPVQQR